MPETIANEETNTFSLADRERIANAEQLAEQMGKGLHLGQWLEIGEVLLMGRRLAMRLAFTNKPEGKGYNLAFGAWLDTHPAIRNLFKSASAMSDLLWILDSSENRTILDELRGRWTPAERARINGPAAARKRIVAELKARAPKVDVGDANSAGPTKRRELTVWLRDLREVLLSRPLLKSEDVEEGVLDKLAVLWPGDELGRLLNLSDKASDTIRTLAARQNTRARQRRQGRQGSKKSTD